MFNPFQPKVDDSSFAARTADWKYFYGNIEEDITPGMPEPLGKSAHKTFFFLTILETLLPGVITQLF